MGKQLRPLDLQAKLSQSQLAEPIRAVRSGEWPKAPVVIDLDPTSFCNLACPGCISTNLLNKERLTAKRLREIAYECADRGVHGVIISGGGEPLVHPATIDVMTILATNGVKVGLVTNGTLISRYSDAISSAATWVRVSVDAGSATTFERIRPSKHGDGKEFTAVTDGIRRLTTEQTCSVGYSFVAIPSRGATTGNLDDISEAIDLASDLGCSYFELKALMRDDHNLEPLTTDELQKIARILEQHQTRTEGRTQVFVASNLDRLLNGGDVEQPKRYTTCPSIRLRMLLTPSGSYPCAYHRGNSRFKIGDPTTNSIADMWTTAQRNPLPNPQNDCQFFCARHESNIEILGGRFAPETVDSDEDSFDPFV